jgi:hypothetical protein
MDMDWDAMTPLDSFVSPSHYLSFISHYHLRETKFLEGKLIGPDELYMTNMR